MQKIILILVHITIYNNIKIIATNKKFLGVIIDGDFDWKNHCEHVIKDLNLNYYVIRNLKISLLQNK